MTLTARGLPSILAALMSAVYDTVLGSTPSCEIQQGGSMSMKSVWLPCNNTCTRHMSFCTADFFASSEQSRIHPRHPRHLPYTLVMILHNVMPGTQSQVKYNVIPSSSSLAKFTANSCNGLQRGHALHAAISKHHTVLSSSPLVSFVAHFLLWLTMRSCLACDQKCALCQIPFLASRIICSTLPAHFLPWLTMRSRLFQKAVKRRSRLLKGETAISSESHA